ncbi:MAG: hypothetical protein ACYTBJ_00270 [Planctomycetota bacterium]|jgi:hypothetical protein
MSVEAAVELRNNVLTKIFPELSREELESVMEAEGDEQQTAAARIILAKLVWSKLETLNLIPVGFRFQSGFVGSQEHSWFELVIHDPTLDPLPMRWIVDPAPIELLEPVIAVGPNSPFQLLYRTKS